MTEDSAITRKQITKHRRKGERFLPVHNVFDDEDRCGEVVQDSDSGSGRNRDGGVVLVNSQSGVRA